MKKAAKQRAAAEARALLGLDDEPAEIPAGQPEPASPITPKAPAPKLRGDKLDAGADVRKQPKPGPDVSANAGGGGPDRESTDLLEDVAPRRVERYHATRDPIPTSHYPRKHAEGSLTLNTPVFYRGERYYVEHCPSMWSRGTGVRISSHPIPKDAQWWDLLAMAKHERLNDKRDSFYVHADELSLAPALSAKTELMVQSGVKPGPSQHAVEERARQKAAGVTDVGDPVAVKLREAKTLDDVYRIGAESLGVPEAELREKYGKLNPGQQRMNVGNRMRAKFRKEGAI